MFLTGLPHSMQIFDGTTRHSVKVKLAINFLKLVKKYDRMGIHCNWSSYRMSFNILEKADIDGGYVVNLLININVFNIYKLKNSLSIAFIF